MDWNQRRYPGAHLTDAKTTDQHTQHYFGAHDSACELFAEIGKARRLSKRYQSTPITGQQRVLRAFDRDREQERFASVDVITGIDQTAQSLRIRFALFQSRDLVTR